MLVPASCTQVPWGDAKGPSWVPAPTVDCVTRGNAEFGRFTAFFLNVLFIYLAESALSCGMWNLHYTMWNVLLWHMDSLVVVHRLRSYGAQA